jgi:opacity protein-like surface antigen
MLHSPPEYIMTMKSIILLMSLVLFTPLILNGQHISNMDFIVKGGIGIPIDGPKEWSANWKWGLTGGLGFSYRFSPYVSVDTHLDYYSFFFDDFDFNSRLPFTEHLRNVEAKSSSIIGLSVHARYLVFPLSDNLSPYFTGGIGIQRFYISKIRIHEQTWDGIEISDQTIPGSTEYGIFVMAGGGLNLTASTNRSYFIEVRYGVGFSGDGSNHFIPVKIGFRHRIK